jgi:hypothetical protein
MRLHFYGNYDPPTRISSDGQEFQLLTTHPSLARKVRERVFTAMATLTLAFRVTEGNSTNHRPLPSSKREMEGFHSNNNTKHDVAT